MVNNNRKSGHKHSNRHNSKPKQAEQPAQANKVLDKAHLVALSQEEQLSLIKELYQKISLQPEQQVKKIQELLQLCKITNLKVVVTALRTLAEIFITVAPLQAIDLHKLQERTQVTITKQQYKIVRFQQLLSDQYQRYLTIIKKLSTTLRQKHFHDQQMYIEFRKCLLECVVKCYQTLWNFNYSKELNQLILKFIAFKECRTVLKEFLREKNIAMIEAKCRLIKGIAAMIVEREHNRLPDDLIEMVNVTYVDARYLEKNQMELNYKKKKLKQKLYRNQSLDQKNQPHENKDNLKLKREKKMEKMEQKRKIKDEVEEEFAEGEAVLKKKHVVAHNSRLLQELFYIYFKILTESPYSKFLKDTLDGMLAFAHLINVDLIFSMIQYLNNTAKQLRDQSKSSNSLPIIERRLMLTFTAQSILNGPLSIFQMSDLKVATNFYQILKDLNAMPSNTKITPLIFRMLGTTIEELLIKRRQLSQETVGSILRELAIMLQRKQLPKLYYLELVRQIALKYEKAQKMFEKDNEGYGINAFNHVIDDPQCSNAINTEILSLLVKIKKSASREYEHIQLVGELVKQLQNLNFRKIRSVPLLEQLLSDDMQYLQRE